MNFFIRVILCLVFIFKIEANCDLKNPNDILNLIRSNHPKIMLNKARNEAFKENLLIAKQRPNPQFDAESTVGDSIDGKVYSTLFYLKHTFELGGKRNSRINVAKRSIDTASAITKYNNEFTIINAVLQLHRLRQVYELIPLYKESLNAFNKILRAIKQRHSLSPEQQVESETLELVTNDYKLKISRLSSEKTRLRKHFKLYMGNNCTLTKKLLPLTVNLNVNHDANTKVEKFSKLNAAQMALKLAQANLNLENSNSYPDLQIGPTYQFEKVNISKINSIGIALTLDLPVLNTNRGGRLKAAKEISAARLNLKNILDESKLDLKSWISKYNQYRHSLKTISNKKSLERKHRKIEALFRRGIISTSLVIESHRQLIEFTKTRFEFENGAVEAQWNIAKINGTIINQEL